MIPSPRLVLTPASTADLDPLHALWTDPEVRRYLFDDQVIDREQANRTLQDTLAMQERGLGLWTVARCEAPQRMIGCAGLLPVSTAAEFYPPAAAGVEPLVALAPEAWGRGYAVEVLNALVGHAVHTLRLERLVAVTDVPNERSDRMLRRAGFRICAETEGPRCRLRHYSKILADACHDPAR